MNNEKIACAVTVQDYGLWRNRRLSSFLDGAIKVDCSLWPATDAARLGWGLKASGKRARAIADRCGLAFLLLEDGFIRSVGVGQEEFSLSLVVDDLGIYYDAGRPSRLEGLIAGELTPRAVERARALLEIWQHMGVSKYNYAPDLAQPLPQPYVLVADQTFGDASIRHGLADAGSFARMLDAALAENPAATVVLKVHPEVMQGRKKGHFDVGALQKNPRILVLAEDVHAASLIAGADAVYTVTSQMGFEGLLWGKRVRTFGMPFYAGWGLTEDELPAPERRRPVALENLVHAALVDYPRYVDPETGERCEPERVIEWMGLQRRMRSRFPAELYAVGFSDWKKPIIRDFHQGSRVHFIKRLGQAPIGATVIAWGTKALGMLGERSVICLEDAFLRSVGLGADLVRPLSWVMDGQGLYYDATQPSRLETLLLDTDFDPTLLQRAAALRERIVSTGLTKYNVGAGGWMRPPGKARVILVPGQVESDASIAFGAPEGVCAVRRNMDLLRAVRTANPDAWVVYKPHPDVLAGLRIKGVDENLALQWCDEQIIDASMGDLLAQVDEVHVITSLAGFEALLRGKRVVCYGQPFYAGWGLTRDMAPLPRRTRHLPLDALVAATLILYPTYISRTTGRFTTPERALDELLIWRERGASTLPWWRKLLRVVLRFYKR